MHLLEYRPLMDPECKPIAPIEVFTQGLLEETITNWYWNDCPLFKIGWLPEITFNTNHPNWDISIKQSHRDQQESLSRRGYRHPHK